MKYYHAVAGTNSRLDTLQAAVLTRQAAASRRLERGPAPARGRVCARGSAAACARRSRPPGVEHIYHLYVIETEARDALQQRLRARQIETGIHYPVPVHLQEACASLGYKAGDFPVTEAAAARMLSLPMFAELTDEQIEYVSGAIENAP